MWIIRFFENRVNWTIQVKLNKFHRLYETECTVKSMLSEIVNKLLQITKYVADQCHCQLLHFAIMRFLRYPTVKHIWHGGLS